MNDKLIDDYINEVTRDMGARQRNEVARELRTHILDSADALAAERKTTVDDVIVREVINRMGPSGKVAALFHDRYEHGSANSGNETEQDTISSMLENELQDNEDKMAFRMYKSRAKSRNLLKWFWLLAVALVIIICIYYFFIR